MSAHTPGPWVAKQDRLLRSVAITNGGIVAVTAGDGSRDQQMANARLIAAAPEFLKALRRIEDMTRMEPDDKDADFQEIVDEVCQLARAAIAKAVA